MRLFNYCFYRIAKAYKRIDDNNYCEWGYGVLFASFALIALAITAQILNAFHFEFTPTINILVVLPFIILDAYYSFFKRNDNKKKYSRLEDIYKNESNSGLKGCLVLLYIIGSIFVMFMSFYLASQH